MKLYKTDEKGIKRYYGSLSPNHFIPICSRCSGRDKCPEEEKERIAVCPDTIYEQYTSEEGDSK